MNNKQVSHLWASQNKDAARGSNFYFEGRTIFSYGPHFPIATFTEKSMADGSRVVLFTHRSYSMTTHKHVALARAALCGLNVHVFTVERPTDGYESNHRHNLQDYRARFDIAVANASKARTAERRVRFMDEARQLEAEANAYAEVFNCPVDEFPQVSPDLLEQVRKDAKDAKAAAERKAKAAAERRAKEYAEAADAWRNRTEDAQHSLWQYHEFPTLLRISADGETVETSRGAEVSKQAARRAWSLCNAARGQSFDYNGPQIGAFTLREVRENGDMVIGCHTLKFAELERCAVALGFVA